MAAPYNYHGGFESVHASGAECGTLYEPVEYDAKFFLAGSNQRTAVLHLERKDSKGFFHRQTMVGLIGYSGDIELSKSFTKDGLIYDLHASGIIDYNFVLANISVKATRAATKEIVCTGDGDYSAFN